MFKKFFISILILSALTAEGSLSLSELAKVINAFNSGQYDLTARLLKITDSTNTAVMPVSEAVEAKAPVKADISCALLRTYNFTQLSGVDLTADNEKTEILNFDIISETLYSIADYSLADRSIISHSSDISPPFEFYS